MCHVLIIEDEPLVAMYIQDILASEGATSFAIAASQSEAVAQAERELPNIITSDVKLLEGTGPAAVAEIEERFGPIPVLFITGTPEDCKPCNPPGSILRKPFSEQDLIAAFRKTAAAK